MKKRISPLAIQMFILEEAKYETQDIVKCADLSSIVKSILESFSGSWFTSFLGGVFSWAKEQVDKEGGVLGFLESALLHGVVDTLAKKMFGWTGVIAAEALQTMLGVDLSKIVKDIITSIIGLFGSDKNKKVSEAQVTQAATDAVNSAVHGDSNQAKIASYKRICRNAELVCLGYKTRNNFKKEAGTFSIIKKFLIPLFSWLFGTILWGAGGLLAGGAAESMFGAVTGAATSTPASSTPTSSTPAQVATHTSTQTIFPLNTNYSNSAFSGTERIINLEPSMNNIEDFLIECANKVYNKLNNKESLIKNNSKFKTLVNYFYTYNYNSRLGTIVVPNDFSSYKDIVDYFIDSVAEDLKRNHQ